jgi:type IV pilus assembly protein PilB
MRYTTLRTEREVTVPSAAKHALAIIDDDTDLRDQLARHFASSYAVVVNLGDPGTLKVLHERPPAAIILDLDLSTFDGFELLRLVSTDQQLRGVPVLALSSHGDFATFEKAHRLGASEFVTKPLSPDELAAKVDNLVSGRQQRSAGRLKLGALLVASGLMTQAQLDGALMRQRSAGGRLGEVLVSEGLVTEHDIVTAVAGQMRIGVVDLTRTAPHANAIGLLPRDFIIRHRLLPLSLEDNGSLVLAMTNPLDVITVDEVGMRTKKRVVPVICTESGFDEAISIYFSSRGKLKDARDNGGGNGDELAVPAADIDASIVEIVDSLLADAASMDASDIHLEPREESLHVRCRIDGVLHDLREFPKELQAGILSRLKIMGNLNIAERRLPQDGRTTFELSTGEAVDLRLASIPSLYGENITIRILEVAPLPPTLASLGLVGDNLARFESALKAPEGGIVIVGPTGSGKSTTLYTTLELIKTPERKVYTVEDPIERKIAGIIQTEVKPTIGLTFAQALRSLVRADPDVIMVGEIRDLETAKMAADSAVTGHQVFSTLHTNDASSAVNRLVEMGVPRYLVAAAWHCFVAQRLVRRLCPHCRKAQTLSDVRWSELGLGAAPKKRIRVFNPVGCTKCFGTGYRGRLGLYEVLIVDDELRDLIATGGTVLEIQRAARAKGVGSLRDDGVGKVLDGSTSYLELLRVTV